MTKKILLLILFQVLPICSFADNKIPNNLFGVTLGEIYKTDNKDIAHILPVKKITGCNELFGMGTHCYFEPIDGAASEKFPYVEKKKNSDDEFYETSFHVYVLPILPSNIDSIEELEKYNNVEIISIDWSEFPKQENNNKTEKDIDKDCYYWAFDLCKTFEVHFSVKPKIGDYYEDKMYRCTFTSDDRELSVTGWGYKQLQLSYKDHLVKKKNEVIEKALRRLAAKKIIP